MKIEYIEWNDSETASIHAWCNRQDIEEELRSFRFTPIKSIGFLLHEDDDCITITLSDAGEQIGPHTTIPKSAIVVRRTLEGDTVG